MSLITNRRRTLEWITVHTCGRYLSNSYSCADIKRYNTLGVVPQLRESSFACRGQRSSKPNRTYFHEHFQTRTHTHDPVPPNHTWSPCLHGTASACMPFPVHSVSRVFVLCLPLTSLYPSTARGYSCIIDERTLQCGDITTDERRHLGRLPRYPTSMDFSVTLHSNWSLAIQQHRSFPRTRVHR